MKAGEIIFYPAHGVARVLGIEEREFGGISAEFFVLELNRGGRSMVPTHNAEQAGLRPLISARKAKDLLKSMKNEPEIDNSKSWKDRAARYSEGLRTGEPETYTSILQELMYRGQADKLSTTESKMLETARSYFISEVGEVLGVEPDKLESDILKIVKSLLPEPEGEEDGKKAKKKATKKKAAKKD